MTGRQLWGSGDQGFAKVALGGNQPGCRNPVALAGPAIGVVHQLQTATHTRESTGRAECWP